MKKAVKNVLITGPIPRQINQFLDSMLSNPEIEPIDECDFEVYKDENNSRVFLTYSSNNVSHFESDYESLPRDLKCEVCCYVVTASCDITKYAQMIQALKKRMRVLYVITKLDGNQEKLQQQILNEFGQEEQVFIVQSMNNKNSIQSIINIINSANSVNNVQARPRAVTNVSSQRKSTKIEELRLKFEQQEQSNTPKYTSSSRPGSGNYQPPQPAAYQQQKSPVYQPPQPAAYQQKRPAVYQPPQPAAYQQQRPTVYQPPQPAAYQQSQRKTPSPPVQRKEEFQQEQNNQAPQARVERKGSIIEQMKQRYEQQNTESQTSNSYQRQTQERYPPQTQERYPPQTQERYPPQTQERYPPQTQERYPPQTQERYPPQTQERYPPQTQERYPPQTQERYPPQTQERYPPQTQERYPPQTQERYPPQTQERYPPQTQERYPPQTQERYPPQTQERYPPQTQERYPPQTQRTYQQQNAYQTSTSVYQQKEDEQANSDKTSKKSLFKTMKSIIPKFQKSNSDSSHYYILVIGEPGVGKSTIIDTVLLNKESTKTEINPGEPFQFIEKFNLSLTFARYDRSFLTIKAEDFMRDVENVSQHVQFSLCWAITEKSGPCIQMKKAIKLLKDKMEIQTFSIYNKIRNIKELEQQMNKSMALNKSGNNMDDMCIIPDFTSGAQKSQFGESISSLLEKNIQYIGNGSVIRKLIKEREDIFKASNVEQYEKIDLNELVDAQASRGYSHLNILIIGQTGAGKSSLVNAFSNALFGQSVAIESSTQSCTMGIIEYPLKGYPVTLIDTRGYEHEKFLVNKSQIETEITRRQRTGKKEDLIHMILYCSNSTGSRLVETEFAIIEGFAQMGIPVIIIVTKQISKNNNLEQSIKNDYNIPTYKDIKNAEKMGVGKLSLELMKNICVISVLAKGMYIDSGPVKRFIQPTGVPQLIDLLRYYIPDYRVLIEKMKLEQQSHLPALQKALSGSRLKLLNILVIGQSGVGKSSLINRLFGYDISKAGCGKAVTDCLTKHQLPKSSLNIFDTVGFELGKPEYVDDIKYLIYRRNEDSDNASKHIHVVWYIVNSGSKRLQELDKKLILFFKKRNIPIIIVLSKCIEMNSDLYLYLRDGVMFDFKVPSYTDLMSCSDDERERLIEEKIACVETNSVEEELQEGIKICVFGMNELLDLTSFYLPIAEKISLQAAQKNDINDKFSSADLFVVDTWTDYIEEKWVKSIKSCKHLLKYTREHMLIEVADVYGLDWNTSNAEWVFDKLKEESSKYARKNGKLQGFYFPLISSLRTKSDAIKFIAKIGNLINESFRELSLQRSSIPEENEEIGLDEFYQKLKESLEE
ncbi:collagen alpha-1(XVIII) chain-like [Histomonas meleagridis]|uniref:collagen alpha-1(XVIII) chain-like n=1 Tax=Histomonas meleagridis TaxID=135588 RepID=UPI0035599742|nr:collagen alpha-1(XVIII) chain-like [Histomonas meleagridis]KAH0805427.1 collagen alpha-1(XVIII) chain-like [Histomonas meleagridis]